MRLLIVNSNTSASVTDSLHRAAQACAGPQTQIRAISAPWGPAAIESAEDARIAGAATIEAVVANSGWAEAAVIACFSDPGLAEARAAVPFPVHGIAEAAMAAAARQGGPFAIVTVAPSTIPQIEALAASYGHADRLAAVLALEMGVLASHADPEALRHGLARLIREAVERHGAQSVVLGGAVTAGFGPALAKGSPVLLFDGLTCAIRDCKAAVSAS